MAKYRKRPPTVEAVQFKKMGDHPLVIEGNPRKFNGVMASGFWIKTIEGWKRVNPKDWIVTDAEGGQYPVSDDVFKTLYEPVKGGKDA